MWPISVASSTPMNMLIALALKPGHPRRKPLFAAATRVVFVFAFVDRGNLVIDVGDGAVGEGVMYFCDPTLGSGYPVC